MEKRTAERKKKRLVLKIEKDDGMLIDISSKGLRVAAEKIPEGETVEIRLKIRDRFFHLKGTIHWVEIKQTLDENPYEIGLSIENPSEEFLDFVESL